MRIGSETASLVNHMYSRMVVGEPAPYVGMPATLLSWTDRNPATVIEVNMSKPYIVVQDDDYRRTDDNGLSESQEYQYTPNPDAPKRIFRKDRKGQWVQHCLNPETNRLVQARGCGLRLQQGRAYGMHGDAIMDFVDGGEQADDLDVAALPQDVQRPGTVFPAAPGEQGFGQSVCLHAGSCFGEMTRHHTGIQSNG